MVDSVWPTRSALPSAMFNGAHAHVPRHCSLALSHARALSLSLSMYIMYTCLYIIYIYISIHLSIYHTRTHAHSTSVQPLSISRARARCLARSTASRGMSVLSCQFIISREPALGGSAHPTLPADTREPSQEHHTAAAVYVSFAAPPSPACARASEENVLDVQASGCRLMGLLANDDEVKRARS